MSSYRQTPEEIEDSIRATHERIDARVNEMQSAFSPARLIERLLPHSNGVNTMSGANVAKTLRDNPVPAALIGTGLAWLVGGAAIRRNGNDSYRTATTHAHDDDYGADTQSADPADRIKEHVAGIKDSVAGGAEQVRETVSSAARTAEENARDYAGRATKAASNAGETLKAAPAQARQLGRNGIQWTRDNPIPTALMCIAAGAAIASVFSLSRNGEPAATARSPGGHTDQETAAKTEPAPAASGRHTKKTETQDTRKQSTKRKSASATQPGAGRKETKPKKPAVKPQSAKTTEAASSTAGDGTNTASSRSS